MAIDAKGKVYDSANGLKDGLRIDKQKEFDKDGIRMVAIQIQQNGKKGISSIAGIVVPKYLFDTSEGRKVINDSLLKAMEPLSKLKEGQPTKGWNIKLELSKKNAGYVNIINITLRKNSIEYWLDYSKEGLNNLLGLRLKNRVNPMLLDNIKAFKSIYMEINNKYKFQNLLNVLFEEIRYIYNKKKTQFILIPIIIPQNEKLIDLLFQQCQNKTLDKLTNWNYKYEVQASPHKCSLLFFNLIHSINLYKDKIQVQPYYSNKKNKVFVDNKFKNKERKLLL